MKWITCGSRLMIPSELMQRFDGISGGYFWTLGKGSPTLEQVVQQTGKTEVWHSFLYGNKHTAPDPRSGCSTIEQWVGQRVGRFPVVSHWTLINEFTDDKGNLYPGYEYENIKKYLTAANQANPTAKLILADFRPYQLEKWQKIKGLCDRLLSEDVPLHGVGIQCHFKTRNAHSGVPGVPFMLDALPTVIQMFDGVLPVHLTEVSGWHHYSEPHSKLVPLWDEIVAIASQNNVESFCPWWLNENDEGFPRYMPSFEEFRGAGIFDKEWLPKLKIFNEQTN